MPATRELRGKLEATIEELTTVADTQQPDPGLFRNTAHGEDGTDSPRPLSVDTSGRLNIRSIADTVDTSIQGGTIDNVGGTVTTQGAGGSSGTTEAIAIDSSGGTLLPSNADRKEFFIAHENPSTLYVSYGGNAGTATSKPVVSNQILGDDVYEGEVTAVAGSGTINARVTEVT